MERFGILRVLAVVTIGLAGGTSHVAAQVPAPSPVPETGVYKPSSLAPSGAAPASAASIVELTGRHFHGPDFEPAHTEAPGFQLFKHYGKTSATMWLKADASRMTFKLKPRAVNGSSPIVNVVAERIGGGKYLHMYLLKDYEVMSDAEVEKQVTMPPGQYRVYVEFYRSSKPADRAHLELHYLRFF